MDSETNEVVKEPFAAVQTLYYGENKYGYSDDVKGRKGKLGPGDTYSDLELETLTLWWGQEKSESGMSLRFEDQFGITPKNQNCQILNYPFTTMPVTIHSWQLNKDTMSGWLDTLEGAGLNMVYTDSQGQQVKREDPGFRIINMLGAGDAADEDNMLRLMRETALKSTSNGEGRIDVANALVSTGIALATTYNIGTDMDMLTMKIVPTADPTVFRGIFLAGINNMIDDNVTGIDPDTSQKDDLDYMPGFADLKNIASMGASGWATDAKNRTENAQKLLKNHATTRNRENNISYMLKGGFETEIYYDYDAGAWKMVVVTGQLNVGGGFGMSWNFNSFCGPVPVTAQLAFGVALDVQFAAAVDRTQMANDYLTQVQLNAFIRAFGGIGFDYAILAMKIGLFGQLSFQGAVRFLNAIGEAQAKVGYKIDFLGEVGIEFLIKFLFITYERVLWSQKIQIPSIQDNNWDAIDAYWEEVQQGNSGNEYEIITPGETQQASLIASQQPELLAADSSTGVALYGAPSTATLESRDYLESPRTYGGSLQVLRARAQTLAENTTSTGYQELIGNSYPNSEPFLTEDGAILAFLHDNDSTQLEDTKASYVQWNGASFGEEDIHAFPDPASTDEGEGEGASAQANQESIQGGDNQLRLAGTNSAAIAAWTRVTETLAKEPGSAVTEDEQLLIMNSSEILASVWDGTQWVTTRLTQNSSADMAPVVAVGGGKALVAWRAVAASDSGAPTEFDSYDTIQYKVYDFKEKNWSGPYTLYNGTSGAVKGMEAQMTESGAMAVAYTIEKGSTSSTTRAVTLEDGTTEITSNLQTVFALIQPDATEGYKVAKNVQVTDDKDVNENPQLTAVKFDGEAEESFILGWHSVHSADGEENNDIRLMAFTEDGTLRGDLVDSISAISSQTGSSITSNFRFAKGADTLSELSILWSQPTMDVDEESTTPENNLGTADSDVLMGVRFRVDNGTIGLTAPIQLAALEEQETTSKTIEAFDGWVQSDGSLKAVVLSTEYGVSDKEGNTYHIELVPGVDNEGNSTGELTEVAIQNSQTNLVSVTGSYTDAIAAEVPVPDYQALAVGASVPVQTTVTNLGTQPIISIDFQVGGASQQAPVTIQPGESATVTTNYTVVETAEGNGVLANPDYTVTATFGSGATARAAASTGTINLNVPNLGVSTFETVQQEDGKRVLRFSLYNNSAAQLENSGRTVKVGLFSDPECTMPIESQYASFCPVSTGTRANGAEFTINSTTDLAAIDQGAYAGQITMDLAAYAKSDPENYMENGEIRSGGVTVDVTFIPEDWPFVDVTEDKWYYDAVAYVYQQGIMVGMSETTFEPNTTVNRAQVVQMLYNLEGQPQVSGDSGFSDIRDDQWYANDVVAGYEDGTFRPTRAVTREEFAQILYNYAKCKGYGLSASADLGKFPDSGQVSSWAETALGWANGNGLINGHDDGRMDPKGSTIRAQAASILMNFDKGFAQEG